jgi:hypothetical protein
MQISHIILSVLAAIYQIIELIYPTNVPARIRIMNHLVIAYVNLIFTFFEIFILQIFILF